MDWSGSEGWIVERMRRRQVNRTCWCAGGWGSRGGLPVVVEATGGVVEDCVGGEDVLERRIEDFVA